MNVLGLISQLIGIETLRLTRHNIVLYRYLIIYGSEREWLNHVKVK